MLRHEALHRQPELLVLVDALRRAARAGGHRARGRRDPLRRCPATRGSGARSPRSARRGGCRSSSTASWRSGDTLAIAEYVAEAFPNKQLWPRDRAARRARAASVPRCTPDFSGLRNVCPMNIEAFAARGGCADLARQRHRARRRRPHRGNVDGATGGPGGPLLFGDFSIADAYFAPVCMRLFTYACRCRRTSTPTWSACACCRGGSVDRRRAGRMGLPRLRGALPPAPDMTTGAPTEREQGWSLDPVADWLFGEGRRVNDPVKLIEGLAASLTAPARASTAWPSCAARCTRSSWAGTCAGRAPRA